MSPAVFTVRTNDGGLARDPYAGSAHPVTPTLLGFIPLLP